MYKCLLYINKYLVHCVPASQFHIGKIDNVHATANLLYTKRWLPTVVNTQSINCNTNNT